MEFCDVGGSQRRDGKIGDDAREYKSALIDHNTVFPCFAPILGSMSGSPYQYIWLSATAAKSR